jgi:hypothetical protein
MAKKKRSSSAPAHDSHDCIRIVPLHVPRALAAPSAAKLTYRKGPLIASAEVFTIFWGKGWKQPPQSALIGQLNGFFDAVLTSEVIDQLGEYSVPGYKIAHGRRTGTTTITTPALKTSVSDSAIQAMLRQLIAAGKAVPKATANTLYFVFVDQGVRVVMGGSASCQAFCGYHNAITGTKIYYAVMPYPGCDGCTAGAAVFDALTTTSSHELCEAITDPIPGEGWYDDANGENGDICAWQTKKIGNYTVQLEWSNKAGRCV